jgi:hypothetical protein
MGKEKKHLIAIIRWYSHLILWRKFLDPIWGKEKKNSKRTTPSFVS